MDASKYVQILFCVIYLLVSKTTCAPTTNSDPYTIKELHITEPTTNKIDPSIVPLTELIQIQTDTIKKIIASSLHSSDQDEIIKTPNKCDDIESGIKETIRKSTFQQDELTETVSEEPEKRGDTLTEVLKQEKKSVPTGRTLFNLYRNEFARTDFPTPSSPIIENNNYQDNQNIILVPCVKRIVNNGTRRNVDEFHNQDSFINQNYQLKQTNEQLIHSIDTSQAYILEKVYSPKGYLLYYMYRLKNTNPEQQATDYTSSSTPSTTTISSITSTTSSPLQDPLYSQQMKFVIQMPYAEPEQMEPYGYKFDQFAYYPPELQPNYVNAPVPYKPTYHMIRTLIIPNEFSQQNNGEYVLNNQQNENNEE